MQELPFNKNIINLSKLDEELRDEPTAGALYVDLKYTDGEGCLKYSQALTQAQIDSIYAIIDNFSEISVHDNIVEYLRVEVDNFVKDLTFNFAADNIEMGITQLGKTKDVADFLRNVFYYLNSYSLYEAANEIQAQIDAGLPPELAPFITAERMSAFRTKILMFLSGN